MLKISNLFWLEKFSTPYPVLPARLFLVMPTRLRAPIVANLQDWRMGSAQQGLLCLKFLVVNMGIAGL